MSVNSGGGTACTDLSARCFNSFIPSLYPREWCHHCRNSPRQMEEEKAGGRNQTQDGVNGMIPFSWIGAMDVSTVPKKRK